jgi:hypothetical protein
LDGQDLIFRRAPTNLAMFHRCRTNHASNELAQRQTITRILKVVLVSWFTNIKQENDPCEDTMVPLNVNYSLRNSSLLEYIPGAEAVAAGLVEIPG